MSRLDAKFDLRWLALKGPQLESEFRFHPERRWRFDRAMPSVKVAIEIEGGTWSGGRHTRGAGYQGDCEKYNAAVAMGWRVFRLTSGLIELRHIEPIIQTCQLLEQSCKPLSPSPI